MIPGNIAENGNGDANRGQDAGWNAPSRHGFRKDQFARLRHRRAGHVPKAPDRIIRIKPKRRGVGPDKTNGIGRAGQILDPAFLQRLQIALIDAKLGRRILNTHAERKPRLTQFFTNAGGFLNGVFSASRAFHEISRGSARI